MKISPSILRQAVAAGALIVLLGGAAPAASAALILVNETFADGDRTTQNPPSSLQWTYGAHHASAAFTSLTVVDNNRMVWDHTAAGGNSFSGVWGYFTPGGSPVTLAVGEKMRLSFNVLFSGGSFTTNANAFRWALFNSNNSRVTTDFAGNNEPGLSSGNAFSSWRGYEATLRPHPDGSTSSNFLLRERTGSGNGLFASTNWTTLSGSGVPEPSFAANTTYSAWLEVERLAGGVTVQAHINGATTNLVTDTVAPFTSFDTIAFFTIDSFTHDITLSNIQLTVVPEPASRTMLLLAAGVLLPLAWRRIAAQRSN